MDNNKIEARGEQREAWDTESYAAALWLQSKRRVRERREHEARAKARKQQRRRRRDEH